VGACCGNQIAAEASAGAWRFPERTVVAMDLRQHWRQQLLRGNGRERPLWQSTGWELGDFRNELQWPTTTSTTSMTAVVARKRTDKTSSAIENAKAGSAIECKAKIVISQTD
jgi:hypothetical protein